jgi:cytochrome P450
MTESNRQQRKIPEDLDPTSPEFMSDEYGHLKAIQEQCPVVRITPTRRHQRYQQIPEEGAWMLTKYEDVARAFRDADLYSSEHHTFTTQTDHSHLRKMIPAGVDPPAHTEYRRILNPMFTQQAMIQIEPYIREFASELLEKMLVNDEFEFVAGFAEPFPSIIFCELMGFPLEDYEQIHQWAYQMLFHESRGPRMNELRRKRAEELGVAEYDDNGRLTERAHQETLMAVTREVFAYFQKLLDERRKKPRDDMMTRLLQSQYAGERPLTQHELEDTMVVLFLGGLDTVTSTFAMIMRYLATHPDKRRELVALIEDEEKLGRAVEELVRIEPAVTPARRVTRPVNIRGVDVQQDERVLLMCNAANRDPEVFPDPEEVVYDRHPNPHVGFALGPHRCLGMHLARRELRIGLQEIHRRMPDYSIKPGFTPHIYGGQRGIKELWLVKG